MLIGWFLQAAASFATTLTNSFAATGRRAPSTREEAATHERLRLLLWKLRRAYVQGVKSGALDELGQMLRRLAGASVGVTELLLAWLDLIETVIQDTEGAFAGRANTGALKKATAKSVLIELISRSRAAAAAPDIFNPSIIWAVVDIFIDAVVRLINSRDLWQADNREDVRPPNWLQRTAHRLALGVLDLLARLYTANLRRTRLSPAVQAAVDRVIAEHPVNPVKLFNGLGDLFDWLRAHREEVLAIVDLVASATQEAERFAGLSGPKKQAYARELLVTFVEVEFGPRYAQALESPLARVILDTVIDGVVMVFRKRGAFRPEVPRVPPAAALGVRQDRVMREVRLRRLRQAA